MLRVFRNVIAKARRFIVDDRKFSTVNLPTVEVKMPVHEYVDKKIDDRFSELKAMVTSINSRFDTFEKNLPHAVIKIVFGGIAVFIGTGGASITIYEKYKELNKSQDKPPTSQNPNLN